MNDERILTTDGLVCGFTDPILGPLDLAIPRDEFVLIEGPNGIGKSTLVETLVGLLEPLSGSYDWRVSRDARRFVPQVRTLDAILPATVADVVATGAQRGSGLAALRSRASSDELETALGRVEMTSRASDLVRELSEGQKQLVLLARALMGEPQVLLLDEPTASMDPNRERDAVELLASQRRERELTVFMIAHGSDAAREAATSILEIDREREVSYRSATNPDPEVARPHPDCDS